ncbi:hypothetical protein RJ55_03347 [Drechmeria coniospora]|nr:hypothetical protein RJ55_03347 [Drechmeria coniospora]
MGMRHQYQCTATGPNMLSHLLILARPDLGSSAQGSCKAGRGTRTVLHSATLHMTARLWTTSGPSRSVSIHLEMR